MHKSRWSACLLGATLACGLLVLAAPARAAEWKALLSLEVTYTWHRDDKSPEAPFFPPLQGTLKLWYRAPSSYRAEDRTAVDGEGAGDVQTTVIVGDAEGMRVSWVGGPTVWVQADNAWSLGAGLEEVRLAGPAGPFVTFRARFDDQLARARTGAKGYRLLPDEVVTGRTCVVLQQVSPSPCTPTGTDEAARRLTVTWWVDKEYGVPLAWREARDRGSADLRATAFRANPALSEDLFTPRTPEGVTVFQGPFAPETPVEFMPAAEFMPVREAEEVEAPWWLAAPPEQQGPLAALVPGPLPPGFADMGVQTSSGGNGPGKTWYISISYANSRTGGVIMFVQGTSEEVTRREKPDREERAEVRTSPARVLLFSRPYAHLALVWEAGGVRYALEGSQVTLAQLRAMAEGMEQVTTQAGSGWTQPDEESRGTATPQAGATAVDGRGVMSMPASRTAVAEKDLAARCILDQPSATHTEWDEEVTRGAAAVLLERAFAHLGRPVPGAGVIPDEGRPESPLTRLTLARSLDSLLGSPALPPRPPELAGEPDHASSDPVWGLHTPEQLQHPDRFRLFRDLGSPADRALVHRLAWWLIIRPPQHDRLDYRFHPSAPVTWDEFVVCLDRAVTSLKPNAPDTSTPEGTYAALVHAFWRADFPLADRYLAAPLRHGFRVARFTFVDAQEVVDSWVTGTEELGDGNVRIAIDYIPQWGDHDTGSVVLQRIGMTWVAVDAQ
jgi:hypothetical protein